MPLVDYFECDGPTCDFASKDYIEDGWIAVPCISWYDGWKEPLTPDFAPSGALRDIQKEPAYKRVIVFDEGRGSKLFCSWSCFSSFMFEVEHEEESSDNEPSTEASHGHIG